MQKERKTERKEGLKSTKLSRKESYEEFKNIKEGNCCLESDSGENEEEAC